MKKYDFSGYATKVDLKCADGRIIRKDAFKHNDGQIVPLVWQHNHNDPANILGHALLENREDGVYAFCTLNDTTAGKNAKVLVQHGDITALSIHANQLKQKGTEVLHGMIREVSLVLTGANPGAFIDNLSIQHSDGSYETDDSDAIIYSGADITLEDIKHEEKKEDSKDMMDIFETLNEEQKNVVYAMLAHALETQIKHFEKLEHQLKDLEEQVDKEDDEDNITHSTEGGKVMKKNIFEKEAGEKGQGTTLTHAQVQTIFADAIKLGSLKEAFLTHAGTYGIDNIDYLFPDAKTVTSEPEIISRRMEWVNGVISGTHHTPFSRIKSLAADITVETARAKGYVTGNLKKEEVFGLLKRVTGPTTIYKKQKLDRDDILDITDLNVVSWLKAEMRVMLDEELARAVLVSDGRAVDDDDKINETCIRPIYTDDDMYAHKVKIASDATVLEKIELIIRARKHYKGTGRPVLYTTADNLTDMLLAKDSDDRRIYKTEAELASDLRVSAIVEVEVMEGLSRVVENEEEVEETLNLVGIIVNLKDYVLGADKGGQVSMFDDFDIDYNQYKYLIETRCSGALVKPKSALVIEQVAVVPVVPAG